MKIQQVSASGRLCLSMVLVSAILVSVGGTRAEAATDEQVFVSAKRQDLAQVTRPHHRGVDAAKEASSKSDISAAEKRHLEKFKAILETSADINGIDERGDTALMRAARASAPIKPLDGYPTIVRFLLNKGADVTVRNKRGQTALIIASERGFPAVVKLLLEKGSDVNVIDRDGWTALTCALWEGASEGFRSLVRLSDRADLNGAKSVWADTKLAIGPRYLEVAKLILEKGVDVNRKSSAKEDRWLPFKVGATALNDGFTVLTWAAVLGHVELVQLLMDKGADPNIRLKDGSTALMWAEILGHTMVAKLLRLRGAQNTLSIAAMVGNEAAMQRCIEAGEGLNERDLYGRTALMEGVWGGQSNGLRLLIEAGSDVNVRDKYDRTALMESIWTAKPNSVRLVLEHGAETNTVNKFGRTALMEAAWAGNLDAATLLIDKGADLNAKDKYGRTALMWAAKMGQAKMAKLLLERGADVNARESDGWTALMDAITTGRVDVVKLLLESGAQINTADKWCGTAMSQVDLNNREIAELLKAYGAK